MPLILVPAVGFAFLITFVVLFGMQQGSKNWLGPLVDSLSHPHGSFLTRTALKAVGAALHGVQWIVNKVEHALSVAASHSMHAAAHWIDGLTRWVTHLVTATGELADETARGFERLVNHTIPRAIHRATAPLWRGIDHLEHDLARLAGRLHAFERGIDRLIAHRVLPAIRAAERAIAVTIPREFARVGHRLGRLEREVAGSRAKLRRLAWAGAFASAAALVWSVLRKWKLQWLRCTNVSRVGRVLCGLDRALLDTLLLDATIIAGSISVVQFAKDMQEVEDELIDILKLGIREL